MNKFLPKEKPEDAWQAMEGDRFYGIRANKDEIVYMRFGPEHGVYVAIQGTSDGCIISSIDYETGNLVPLGKITEGATVSLGRATTCDIKILHAIMSRRHLELSKRGNVMVSRDLGSTNKTFVFQDNRYFDIEKYVANHPLDQAAEGTLDSVREAFGPAVTDFLKKFMEEKDKQP